MDKLVEKSSQCQIGSGATSQEIFETIPGKFSDSPALKKHMFCMSKKLNLISENGRFRSNNIRSKLNKVIPDERKVDKLMNQCLIQKRTPTDTAYDALKCISENRNVAFEK